MCKVGVCVYLDPAVHAGGQQEVRGGGQPARRRHALRVPAPRVDVRLRRVRTEMHITIRAKSLSNPERVKSTKISIP